MSWWLWLLASCTNERSPAPAAPSPEFVAQDADVQSFATWQVVRRLDRALSDDGRAHTDAARTIYVNAAGAMRGADGQYPLGTILIKQVEGGYGIVGMAKRGGSFNTAHNGWEWLNISAEGRITLRTASPLCNQCHAKARDQDYVFTR